MTAYTFAAYALALFQISRLSNRNAMPPPFHTSRIADDPPAILPPAICYLPSAICYLLSAIVLLPSAIVHLSQSTDHGSLTGVCAGLHEGV